MVPSVNTFLTTPVSKLSTKAAGIPLSAPHRSSFFRMDQGSFSMVSIL